MHAHEEDLRSNKDSMALDWMDIFPPILGCRRSIRNIAVNGGSDCNQTLKWVKLLRSVCVL